MEDVEVKPLLGVNWSVIREYNPGTGRLEYQRPSPSLQDEGYAGSIPELLTLNSCGYEPGDPERFKAMHERAVKRILEPYGPSGTAHNEDGTYMIFGSTLGASLGVALIPAFALYFLPSIVAFIRRVPNSVSILIINLFLGWSIIGWIVALAMAARSKPTNWRA